MNTLIKITEYANINKETFINPNHIIYISKSDFNNNVWRIHMTNGHSISLDDTNMKLLIDKCCDSGLLDWFRN